MILPAEEQAKFVSLVDAILNQIEQGDGSAILANKRAGELERELDEKVAELYRVTVADGQRAIVSTST
jgi:hypothetical protein